jgi:8-oxo-dGTP pyrophosphatase MutT (NUDIX family)
MTREYTHPDVFDVGVAEGWAEAETDPARIDWAARQASAAIPFQVVNGRPVNPCEKTGITRGRNEMGFWGEQKMADALVTCTYHGRRYLLMIERADGYGWAVPGGHVEPGETGLAAAVRELAEETGLTPEIPAADHLALVADALSASKLTGEIDGQRAWLARHDSPYAAPRVPDALVMSAFIAHCCIMLRKLAEAAITAIREMPPRYVPDPRSSDEAWAVTIPVHIDLGDRDAAPAVNGGDDARRAEWIPADSYDQLRQDLARHFGGRVFAAHQGMLRGLLGDRPAQGSPPAALAQPCPPWCTADHSRLTACSAPATAITLPNGAVISARARRSLAFGEHVLVSGISGVHATDPEDAACLATLLDVLAEAAPGQHRELAAQVRAAAALVWGDR